MEPNYVPPVNGPTRRIIDVPTTRLYADPLYGKPRGVRYDQGLTGWIRVPLFSEATGAPLTIHVGSYSSPPIIQVRMKEACGNDPHYHEPQTPGELQPDGKALLFPMPPEVTDRAGVYRTQARVLDGNGVEVTRDEFLILVDRGMWSSDGSMPSNRGPPTFAEIRTLLRDHPGANRLLANYEFDPAEIGEAIVSAVQAFNGGFPPLPARYLFSTHTFPIAWRRPFLDGILSYLFEMAAVYFRRGNLPYAGGGISINDLAKDKDYQAATEGLRAKYLQFVKTARAAISINSGFGSVGSIYPVSTY